MITIGVEMDGRVFILKKASTVKGCNGVCDAHCTKLCEDLCEGKGDEALCNILGKDMWVFKEVKDVL